MSRYILIPVSIVLLPFVLLAQPSATPDGVRFAYENAEAQTVSLVGDFNSWSGLSHPMKKTESGEWIAGMKLLPGTYQYGYLVDGNRIMTDPRNPLTFEVVDGSRINSLITIQDGKIIMEGYPVRRALNDNYPKRGGTVYLNLIFKHHLPLYYNARKDQIDAPFVRMHATRDYFELADVIQRYPNVHATTVLSPTLLWQIQEIYVNRMEPYIIKNKTMRPKPAKMNAAGFLAAMKGKTDPWIDICLTPAERMTDEDKNYLYRNQWNAFTISPVRMNRLPEMVRLHEKWVDSKGNPSYSVQELRTLKFFAIFAHFDTEFFERSVPLIQTGTRIKLSLDLRDLISYRSDGKYYLKRDITEDDCHRIVASSYYIMSSILPTFEKVRYDHRAKIGQMDLAATSFADAVLPLLINSDVARDADPNIQLPAPYANPGDAEAQLQMSLTAYQKYFNHTPTGYIPPYGAMAPNVIPILKKNGFTWFSSHEAVLRKSQPDNLATNQPYVASADGASLTGVFSDDLLTTRINWVYRNYYAENSAHDFIENLLTLAPKDENEDALVTVVIDNDDAWLQYNRDTDGKGFVNGIYRKLNKLFESRAVVTVTMPEYLSGNRLRGIAAHAELKEITALGSGSRLDGNFNAWIGNQYSNAAWETLGNIRKQLSSVTPDVSEEFLLQFAKKPFTMFYGATSQHWFASFNPSLLNGGDPKPYEMQFLNMAREAVENAGGTASSLASFLPSGLVKPVWERQHNRTRVTFLCKLVDREAITSVFIAGNRKELGNLEPNTIRMWDNGEYGDEVFGNNEWTIVVDLEPGELLYKYTNSGGQGTWDGAETFPDIWRKVIISGEKMTISDVFARLPKTVNN